MLRATLLSLSLLIASASAQFYYVTISSAVATGFTCLQVRDFDHIKNGAAVETLVYFHCTTIDGLLTTRAIFFIGMIATTLRHKHGGSMTWNPVIYRSNRHTNRSIVWMLLKVGTSFFFWQLKCKHESDCPSTVNTFNKVKIWKCNNSAQQNWAPIPAEGGENYKLTLANNPRSSLIFSTSTISFYSSADHVYLKYRFMSRLAKFVDR